MKYRSDFVTNSSSSSFIVGVLDEQPERFPDVFTKEDAIEKIRDNIYQHVFCGIHIPVEVEKREKILDKIYDEVEGENILADWTEIRDEVTRRVRDTYGVKWVGEIETLQERVKEISEKTVWLGNYDDSYKQWIEEMDDETREYIENEIKETIDNITELDEYQKFAILVISDGGDGIPEEEDIKYRKENEVYYFGDR